MDVSSKLDPKSPDFDIDSLFVLALAPGIPARPLPPERIVLRAVDWIRRRRGLAPMPYLHSVREIDDGRRARRRRVSTPPAEPSGRSRD